MAKTGSKTNIINYFTQVKSEMKKVTWPSRQETTISTITVFVMALIAATFLYFADQIIAWAVRLILGFGA
jgi:preprotein translocase subunit SecE